MTSGVTGKTWGVGHDIIAFLTVVAKHFQIHIVVTSGYRDSSAQARAMFDNWLKLDRGNVYKKSTLPEAQRKSLDDFYNIAMGQQQSATAKAAAKQSFLDLAAKTVGGKSAHAKGRAVDVARASLSRAAHTAILAHTREVKEGNRNDICHFENLHIIPTVTEADLASGKIKPHAATPHTTTLHTHATAAPHHAVLAGDGGDYVCVC